MSFFRYPTGAIVPMATPFLEDRSWLPCDGQTYDGTDSRYANLWTVIGNTYGGSGVSQFAVPHIGGRVPVGQVSTPSGSGIDGPAGSWTGSSSVTLTAAQSGRQAHSHTINDPGHSHPLTDPSHAHQIPVTATTSWVGTSIVGYGPPYQSYEIIRYDTDSKGLPVAVYGYVTKQDPIYGPNTPSGYIYYPVDYTDSTTDTRSTQDGSSSTNISSASVNVSLNSIADVSASEAHDNMMPAIRLHYLIKL